MLVGIRPVGRSCVPGVMFVALLAGRPGAAAAQQPATLSGIFHSVWVDPRNGPAPEPLYFVSGPHGSVRLELTAAELAALGGRQMLERRPVVVSGALEPVRPAPGQPAAMGAPASLRVTGIRAEAALVNGAPQSGSRAYATILCRFPDVAAVPGTRARYQAITGTASPGLDHYWREVSENIIDLSGSLVTDWYTLPQPHAYYVSGASMDLTRLADDCAGAADADLDYSTFDGINLQFNGAFPSSWGGGWWFTRDGVNAVMPITWLADWAGQSVYAHEVGHSFGLPHSSGQYGQIYDSPWDVMSSSYVRFVGGTHDWIGQQTITYHKGLLGWLGDRSLTAGENAVEATIGRSAQPSAGGLLEVRIPIAGSARFYTVEARKQVGYDAGLPREGIVIHLVDPALPEPARVRDGDANGTTNDAGSAWLPGETFHDPAARIAVRVDAATATGWTIRARRNTAVLSASIVGPGSVTSAPGGIDCPADCSEPYGGGESVTLTATPGEGAVFAGWSGACSGTGECVLAPTGDISVSATFVAPVVITVVVEGPGAVTSAPAGISCPADCTESVSGGSTISLAAVPADGATFVGWGGACTGTEECELVASDDATVTASFSAPLAITSSPARPGARMGAPYADQLEASGGEGARAWSVADGALPDGLTLSVAGAIAGIPTEEGEFTFVARIASDGLESTKELRLVVTSPALAVTAVVDAVIAPQATLDADERRYLDLQGNRNGRVDAGDVRAWLQRQGLVPATERKEP